MDLPAPHRKKQTLAQFALPNDALAYAILILDFALYFGCVVFSILVEHLALKLLFASLAGFFIAQLFVIAHDAAHTSYVSSRRANGIIARLTFMPTLHNYTIWQFVHNRLHHAFPNVKNYNSWSPMSYEEYQRLPKWRQLLEHVYRSPLGYGPYYLIERWFKDKLLPRKHTPSKYHAGGWRDFWLNLLFAACLLSGIVALAMYTGQSPVTAILISAVIPFLVWNYAMGLTTYQQHTHPTLKWYPNLVEGRASVKSYSEVTIYMQYPKWYLYLTHNCYAHPAHHINARIPLYRLQQAQQEYMQLCPEKTHHVVAFSMKEFLQTQRTCKLYDYTRQQWLDFSGQPTTPALASETSPADSATSLLVKKRAI